MMRDSRNYWVHPVGRAWRAADEHGDDSAHAHNYKAVWAFAKRQAKAAGGIAFRCDRDNQIVEKMNYGSHVDNEPTSDVEIEHRKRWHLPANRKDMK